MSTSLNLVRAEQRESQFQSLRLAPVHVDSGAVPEPQFDLDRLLSPVLVFIYNSLGRAGNDRPSPRSSPGDSPPGDRFLHLRRGARWAIDGKVSSWIMVWGYGLYSLGELLVSGLGLAMIARYVPARMGGFMMGAYLSPRGSRNISAAWSRTSRTSRKGLRIRSIAEHLHQSVQQARICRGALHRHRGGDAAADEASLVESLGCRRRSDAAPRGAQRGIQHSVLSTAP